ncbi:MAG: transcription factor S [Methanocellales archaeon]
MVEFCPKCKSLMLPMREGELKIYRCRKCGEEIPFNNNHYISKTEGREKLQRLIEDEFAVLPVTNAKCPECGNSEAYWWIRQLRRSDESEVRFFRCTKCKRTWREYN